MFKIYEKLFVNINIKKIYDGYKYVYRDYYFYNL